MGHCSLIENLGHCGSIGCTLGSRALLEKKWRKQRWTKTQVFPRTLAEGRRQKQLLWMIVWENTKEGDDSVFCIFTASIFRRAALSPRASWPRSSSSWWPSSFPSCRSFSEFNFVVSFPTKKAGQTFFLSICFPSDILSYPSFLHNDYFF